MGLADLVAERLTRLISPYGFVAATDHWMPEGFTRPEEAQLHQATRLLDEKQ